MVGFGLHPQPPLTEMYTHEERDLHTYTELIPKQDYYYADKGGEGRKRRNLKEKKKKKQRRKKCNKKNKANANHNNNWFLSGKSKEVVASNIEQHAQVHKDAIEFIFLSVPKVVRLV